MYIICTYKYGSLTSEEYFSGPPDALLILVPDRSSRILEVVIMRRLITWVLGIWRGEGLGRSATARYFYGSILLRAIKSKIIVVLTYVHRK
jgi:hypothetical protein